MGCSCSSTDNKDSIIRSNVLNDRNSSVNPQQNNLNPINNINYNRSQNINIQPNQRQNQQRARQNIPNYIPYLQSQNDPTFNMKETKDTVGSGYKKMNSYICSIEKDDLIRKRNDFWTSRFEGSPDTWDLLRNLCEGSFPDDDLVEILQASGLTPYAGCINILYDLKGNLYEIPNYCIHDPLIFDIPKLKMEKPNEINLSFIVRLGIEELNIQTTNFCPIIELKKHISENFNFNKIENIKSKIDDKRIRLFFYGKEMKDADLLYMHYIDNGSIILMSIKEL